MVRCNRSSLIYAAMCKLVILAAAVAALAACASSPDAGRTCAELAHARAAGQMERETALLEEQERGRPDKSEVQRKLIAMDAETYRAAVYEECLRRRGPATEDD